MFTGRQGTDLSLSRAALETAKESVALGAFDYLAKPVGPQDVIQVTHEALVHKGWVLRREPADAAPMHA